MDLRTISVKKGASKVFLDHFRFVLYDSRLTFGARCLAMAVMDLPGSSPIVFAKLARKIKSLPSQVSVWKLELLDHGFTFEPENN